LLIVTWRTVSTERIVQKRTAELEERERRFRDLLEATPDPVLILRDAREIVLVNFQAKQAFGYSEEELVGKDVEDLIPERFHEQFRQRRSSYLENSASRAMYAPGFELMVKRRDGSEYPAEMTLNQMETRHGFLVVVAIRDVSTRKRLEEEVRQSQKMEAIGTLASGVAHDFNNLLMGVSGCSSIALSLLANEDPARVYLNEIKRSCESGAAITRQLLAFSRHKDIQMQPVDINEVISNSTTMLKRLLGENIDLEVHLDAVGARTIMDPGQLEQVLMNLIVNAHDAMPWGGRLSIDTGMVLLRDGNRKGLPGGPYVVLTVSDTGHGMTEDTRRRIFEPFFTTKPVGKGTGLGLSTVHAVISQAGGHISVHSRPGEGARFRALLPALTSEMHFHDKAAHA
jgi:PAS domain S-box-containing protein